MRIKTAFALVAAAALAVPAGAGAHVTLQPEEAAAGSYTVLDVRVPNERDNADTTKLDVQFPPGFASVSYQAVPGWSVKVIKRKLAKPLQTDDGPVTEAVHEMIWSGGRIPPGQFLDFPISVKVPGKAGDKLTFKALQTYDNGEVVRWIGPPSAAEPAPQVAVTSADGGDAAASDPDSDSGGSGGSSKALAIVALVLGALGLSTGGAALRRSRNAS